MAALPLKSTPSIALAVASFVAVPELPETEVGAAGIFTVLVDAAVTLPLESTVTCGTEKVAPAAGVAFAEGP